MKSKEGVVTALSPQEAVNGFFSMPNNNNVSNHFKRNGHQRL